MRSLGMKVRIRVAESAPSSVHGGALRTCTLYRFCAGSADGPCAVVDHGANPEVQSVLSMALEHLRNRSERSYDDSL